MTQLTEYYRHRAAEYDAVYAKPERQDDLATLHRLLPPLVQGRRVLEIAAGTGYWTRTLSQSAAAITATDLNPETLDVARARDYGPAAVTFRPRGRLRAGRGAGPVRHRVHRVLLVPHPAGRRAPLPGRPARAPGPGRSGDRAGQPVRGPAAARR